MIKRIILKDGKFCIDGKLMKDNYIQCFVIFDQRIKAQWWKESKKIKCASVNDVPVVKNPVSYRCDGCPSEPNCKKALRLWIVMNYDNKIRPFIVTLDSDAIQEWDIFKTKIINGKLSLDSVYTVLSFYKNLVIHMNGFAVTSILKKVRTASVEMIQLLNTVTDNDFV